MKQSIDSGFQFDKCTEVGHSCNLTGNDITYCILLLGTLPGICIIKLQGQSDLGIIDLFYQDGQLLTNLKYLLGMLHPSPRHLRDMKQTVCSAKIHKCTEISHILHSTFYDISGMNSLEESLLCLSLLSNQKLLAVTDISSSLWIILTDYELNFLTGILGKVLFIHI